MQKGTAEKLITALRSGKYDYGNGQLRYDNCYCLLGVLLDIINPNLWTLTWDRVSYTWDGEQFFLPDKIMKGSKIKNKELLFKSNENETLSLITIHDYYDDKNRKNTIKYLEMYYEQM